MVTTSKTLKNHPSAWIELAVLNQLLWTEGEMCLSIYQGKLKHKSVNERVIGPCSA